MIHSSSPPVSSWARIARSLFLFVMFCRLLFVLLSFKNIGLNFQTYREFIYMVGLAFVLNIAELLLAGRYAMITQTPIEE